MNDTRTTSDTLDVAFDDDATDGRGGQQTIASYMSDAITYASPTSSLRDLAEVLRTADVSLAVVADGATVIGVVSERDIVAAVALGLDLDRTTVETIETENLRWAASTSSVDDVAEEMLENYVRHVLIGSDDGLVGVVSMRDLLTAYLV